MKTEVRQIIALSATAMLAGACLLSGCAPTSPTQGGANQLFNNVESVRVTNNVQGEAGAMMDMSYDESVDFNTEAYDDTDKNTSFILTANKPFSTFSADVDTASYCNFRRLVNESTDGTLPSGALRTEEMVNYFDYSYNDPEQGDLFGVTTKITDSNISIY